MEKDMVLDMMLAQRWSDGACRGYVIWAMENCGFTPDDILRIVSELQARPENGLSLVIDGCSVSITSSPKGTDDPMKTVREILLSAYRTKQPRCRESQGFFDVSGQK